MLKKGEELVRRKLGVEGAYVGLESKEGREEWRVGRYHRRNGRNGMSLIAYFAFVVPPPVTLRWHGIRCGDVKAFAAVAVNFAY